MKHYIGMAGLHGCLLQYCEVYDTYEEAVNGLSFIHELGRDRRRRLRKDGYLEMNIHRDGNEYCEIAECDCDTPEIHGDSLN